MPDTSDLQINVRTTADIGTPGFLQGPTMDPTSFDAQGYPKAIPAGDWANATDPIGALHSGQQLHPRHSGGPIGRFHFGGSIGSFPRFHSGGSLGSSVGSGAGRPQIHINNFTDLKILAKQLASQTGKKIIIDTVRGARIDLGI